MRLSHMDSTEVLSSTDTIISTAAATDSDGARAAEREESGARGPRPPAHHMTSAAHQTSDVAKH